MFALIFATLLVPLPVFAMPSPAPVCAGAIHHEFDFWLGDWQVYRPDGKLVGQNHVTREYNGCVIHEHYSSTQGSSGESINIVDPGRKDWHQTWVDSTGQLLLLEGGIRRRAMILEGHTAGYGGATIEQRITWTPNPDGSVRQLWEATDAKGKWTTVFDGIYKKN